MVTKRELPSEGGNGVNISGPGGLGISASGREVVLVVMILAGFSAIGWFMRDIVASHHQDQNERRSEHQAIITQHRDLMLEVVRWGNRCVESVEPRHFDPRENR